MEEVVNNNSSDKITEYRFERKFLTTYLDEKELESILKLNSFTFKEIFHTRYVNNIYYDTHSMDNYFDNVDGRDNRIKARIRWYGDLEQEVKSPILEFKNKFQISRSK